jgi:nucleoside 2-deoxyribosyltransferase
VRALSSFGWPRLDLDREGPAAGDAAWLLLQHADRRNEDRAAALPDLARAVQQGHADPRHLALLTDRERAVRGEPQRYGTFVLVRDVVPEFLYPIEDAHRLEQRRADVGLPALAADTRYAFSPIIPYGPGRTAPVNPWRPGCTPPAAPDQPEQTSPRVDPPVGRPGGTAVYLAATLRHRNEVRRIRARLPPTVVSTARWLDIDPLTRASCQFDAAVALTRFAARLCFADIRGADAVVALPFTRRSAGVSAEIGYALAHDKPVVVVGRPECSFDMLDRVHPVADMQAAIRQAAEHGSQTGPGPGRGCGHRDQPPVPVCPTHDPPTCGR